MRRLMEARYPVYRHSDVVVESRDVPHEIIVTEIVEALAVSPALAAPRAL
jgi:shikimate kinase